jgi:pimeloyl-ACP methyl ester carboxylesterase
MAYFERDGLRFNYREVGSGVPFVFQHGLGGDVNQPFGVFVPPAGFRMLALDCRAHGETRPLGDVDRLGLAAFADDLLSFLDHLGVARAIVGGISMGAAVALYFALRNPGRVLGLVLSRPAWLDGPNPFNVAMYGQIARLIRAHGAAQGLALFRQAEEYRRVHEESPDAANSLVGQFEHPRAEETVARLERIPPDAPVRDLGQLATIRVPALVLASRQDPVHPFDYGEVLSCAIPNAEFHELTPKSVSKDLHTRDVQTHLARFLCQHWPQATAA